MYIVVWVWSHHGTPHTNLKMRRNDVVLLCIHSIFTLFSFISVEFELSAKLFGLNCESAPLCLFRVLVRFILASMPCTIYTPKHFVSVWVCMLPACLYCYSMFVRGHCFIHQIERRQIRISVTIFVNRFFWRIKFNLQTQTFTRMKKLYMNFSYKFLLVPLHYFSSFFC